MCRSLRGSGYKSTPLARQQLHAIVTLWIKDCREAQQKSFTMKTAVSLVVLAALCLSVQAAPARSTFYKGLNETAKVEGKIWTDCSK